MSSLGGEGDAAGVDVEVGVAAAGELELADREGVALEQVDQPCLVEVDIPRLHRKNLQATDPERDAQQMMGDRLTDRQDAGLASAGAR